VKPAPFIDPALPVPPRVPDRQAGSQFLMYALPGVGELYVRSVLSRRLPQLAGMRQAATRNPGWETVILPGVGHTPQLEVPGTVAGRLAGWLERHF